VKRLSLSLTSLILTAGAALGQCNLTDFDSSLPQAVSGTVPRSATYFEWASDADPSPDGDGERAWHYIRNLHDDGLSLIWEKPDALIPFDEPLGKGEVSCFIKYGAAFAVDRDAPITTNRDGRKDAKAYLRKGRSEKTGAEVGRDGDGIRGRIRAILRYFQSDRLLVMQLFSSSDDIRFLIGITGLGIPEDALVGGFSDAIGSKPVLESGVDVFSQSGDLGVQFVQSVANSRVMTFQLAGEAEIVFKDVAKLAPVKLPLAIMNADGRVLAATKIDLGPLIEN